MNQKKILIITKEDVSSWKSCQHIVQNLLQSYHLVSEKIEYLKVEEDLSFFQANQYAQKIKTMNIDFVAWIDHKPCGALMLNALNKAYVDTAYDKKPKFLIHLFGDFVLDCLQWEYTQVSLNQYPVHFIVASEAQKKLVDKLFISAKNISTVIPFPVDEKAFNLKNHHQNKLEIRKKLEAENDEIIMLYTGRISLQKNVEVLVNSFNKIKNFVDKKIQLWIVGPWDDLLLPYQGVRGLPGSNFHQFNSSIIGNDLKDVRFLGDLNADELGKVYHAADLFVSFSTFNDEDYGMSVAEALVMGLPCVLSNWGGFSSFADYSKSVDLVPVEFDGVRMKVDSKIAQKKLLAKLIQVSHSEFSKSTISNEAFSSLSFQAISLKISEVMSKMEVANQIEFSALFYKMCSLFSLSQEAPFKNNASIYQEIYGSYNADKL